jgi:hypothetical protein
MALKYLRICNVCGNSFDSDENLSKEDSVCMHCQMMPETKKEYVEDAPTGISPGGIRTIITTPKDKNEERCVETIDSGMTGLRKIGTSNPAASKPHRHHIFKKKNCKKCKKIYQPTSGNDVYCPECKPLSVIKTRQAQKYVAEKETPRLSRGRHVNKPDRVALEKLADGLLTEPRNMSGLTPSDPVHYTPGLALLKKQETYNAPLPGLWIRYAEAGLTFDKRQYVTSKEIITGQVCVDLWSPRERFVSDSTSLA